MIVPALVLAMQKAGLGTVDVDLYWEALPRDSRAQGIWVVTRGDGGSTDDYELLTVDVYARFTKKLDTEVRLDAVVDWLRGDAKNICTLSANPYELDPTISSNYNKTYTYDVIDISHTGALQNTGIDENFRIIKTITLTIKFNKRKEN